MKQYSVSVSAQRGSTVVGFVVGVLVGLAAALVVAIYVTRMPVPFVDRGVSRKATQDAEEAERNKGWDPNAGLVGKQPVVPPVVDSAPPAPGQATAEKAPAPASEAAPDAAADPLGDLMKAKAGAGEPGAEVSAAPADPFVYFVQAGAFRSGDEAQAQKARLAMMGMDATITEREQGGRMVYRVRMGPFSQKVTAEMTREQLQVGGVEAALVRVQR